MFTHVRLSALNCTGKQI